MDAYLTWDDMAIAVVMVAIFAVCAEIPLARWGEWSWRKLRFVTRWCVEGAEAIFVALTTPEEKYWPNYTDDIRGEGEKKT